MSSPDSEPKPLARCTECGNALAPDQRYCLHCGTRRGTLPTSVAVVIGDLRAATGTPTPTVSVDPPPGPAGDDDLPSDSAGAITAAGDPDADEGRDRLGGLIPAARGAAISILLMIAFGCIIGAATAPGGVAALADTLVVAVNHPAAPAAVPLASTGGSGSPASSSDGGAGGAGAPGAGASAGGGGAVGAAPQAQQTVTVPYSGSSGGGGGGGGGSGATGGGGATSTTATSLPPIGHIWDIVLSDQGYSQSFGDPSADPYLAKTLASQGELVEDYDAVATSPLANEIALISGQGPTSSTLDNCPQYTDISPGTAGDDSQVLGAGCLYPSTSQTIGDQLEIAGMTWRAYVQGVGEPAQLHPPTTTSTTATSTSGTLTTLTTPTTPTSTPTTVPPTTTAVAAPDLDDAAASSAPRGTTETATTTTIVGTPTPTTAGVGAGPVTTTGIGSIPGTPTATRTGIGYPPPTITGIVSAPGSRPAEATTPTGTETSPVTSSSTSTSASGTPPVPQVLTDTSTEAGCPHPATGATDANHAVNGSNEYVTWKNPWVYFHSIVDGTECAKADVGLSALTQDLRSESSTPTLSYVAPSPCDDGSDTPCRAGASAGLAQADAFLKTVVPKIEASPAYQDNGLILITFDEAPQSGPNWSTGSCCDQPTFPNTESTLLDEHRP